MVLQHDEDSHDVKSFFASQFIAYGFLSVLFYYFFDRSKFIEYDHWPEHNE